MQTDITIDTASVKVMRSHDYCHFEVMLGTSSATTPEQVDALRKTAALLADKAVHQYKIAKASFEKLDREAQELHWEARRVEELEKMPETERTPEQQARIKALHDVVHVIKRRYDYKDDWRDDGQNMEEDE